MLPSIKDNQINNNAPEKQKAAEISKAYKLNLGSIDHLKEKYKNLNKITSNKKNN